MRMSVGVKKTCKKGHLFTKSSDCPTCPVCEQEKAIGLFGDMGAPVRRAMENNAIKTLKQLSKLTKKEVISLHGVGPSAIPKFIKKLQAIGLQFKK